MSDSFYVVDCLFFKFLFKLGTHPYVCARNHKVLPYDKTVFVAKLIEIIAWIVSTAPNANTVEVGKNAILN